MMTALKSGYETRIPEGSRKIITHHEIEEHVTRVANDIELRLGNTLPVLLGIMNGATCFSGTLLPKLDFPLEYDTFSISRYGKNTIGGAVKSSAYPATSIRSRTVLILDDILDQGVTLRSARRWAIEQGAEQVVTAVLITKKSQGVTRALTADFSCFTVGDEFVFGFGMDINGLWRNLKDIYAIKNPAMLDYSSE